ncbi:sulfatase [Formosa agariphila]|uniref:Sulfatase n=1 Tax=Formosa agariphila (strain DSM 15362 / KCTC 12365 / LMG 23005 / KMM 3901 / M-2Alg 35-1) TaxID=1347342 RepID=PLH14_FORAG|nr:sulfatase [Formosa agariphila]T2KMG4.2 RecName: Full=Sulfatase; AltName: Full=Arylsulfatase; AltName: Full=Polysaccharide utilization locus H protein P14; Short=PUL H protein P14; AltName: Full=Sulfatase family S1 subfamily 7 protein P14; Short=P14_S1_7; Flags: Precursor [Formosa agariphila KMM 3901]
MKTRYFLLLGICMLSCRTDEKKQVQKEVDKPNVLFIAVDDLNNMISPIANFSNIQTPNFDRLAAMGVTFTDAHCPAPLCGPSRSAIMTGLRPSTTGIYGMTPDNKIRRDDNEATKDIIFLPEYFKKNGYHSMGIGKLFHNYAPDGMFDEGGGRVKGFGPFPEKRFVWDGFGTSKSRKGQYGRTNTDWGAFPESDTLMPDHQAVNWVLERFNKNYKQPFFLALGFQRPHVPLYVPQKWFDLYPLESIQTPPYQSDDLNDIPPVGLKINDLPMMPSTEWAINSGEWKKIIQAYLACVSFVDYELGRVLDALKNSPYAKNTIIVLWSDHGYRLGEKGTFAKHALWESATKAPLFFAGPNLPKGKKIDAPVEMLSIYPTLLELSGLQAYARNEAKSLVRMMQKNEGLKDTYAITTYGKNNHAVKVDGYRYIQYEDGTEEFYDNASDPNEWINEANNFKFKSKIEALKALLPKTNATWDAESNYTFQPYFVEQKTRGNVNAAKAVKVIGAER